MSEFLAILVEDEAAAAAETRTALESAGFTVLDFRDASSALSGIESEARPIDILVLDRRLPVRYGESATDQVGDDLLGLISQLYPELLTVVFSGRTGFEHAQFATARRGSISMRQGGIEFDKVTAFAKGQSLEFDNYLSELIHCLNGVEDIEIRTDIRPEQSLSVLSRRIIKRIGYEFSGSSVRIRPLVGGLTEAPVWLCDIDGSSGPVARLVAKRQARRPRQGGFQSMLPASLSAGTVSIIHGFLGGYWISVQQVAGSNPISMLDLVGSAPDEANELLLSLCDGLREIRSGQQQSRPISEIVAPIESWEALHARGLLHGIQVPPGSRNATTVTTPQHGDLHPANVLGVSGSPVVIDFDSQTDGSELIDAVNLFLGAVFHRESPLRSSKWPTPEQCSELLTENFLNGCPAASYMRTAMAWVLSRKRSDRELYAVIMAYSLRQLKYSDVIGTPDVLMRAKSIAGWATAQLDRT